MARLLPVLPLRDTVIFPGMITRLQVQPPDAVAAVELHLSSRQPLLAVPLRAALDVPTPDDLYDVGCTAQVLKLVRLGDGTVRCLVEGIHRVRVHGMRPDPDAGLAAVGRVLHDLPGDPARLDLLSTQLREQLRGLVSDDKSHHQALVRIADLDMAPGRLADLAIGNLTLPWADKVELLGMTDVAERLEYALVAVTRERELRRLDQKVQQTVVQTMDKQQRDYFIREKIRGLQAELSEGKPGEDGGAWEDAAQLEQRVREAGIPEDHLEEVLREVRRLSRMHPDASEYSVARTWIDWLLSMPWKTVKEENADLRHAKQVLDEDHYGLVKVKDRILEHLAVRQLNPTGQSPVICFLGPPGVGKTSLGRSIARALGRDYQRVSLGGVKDEAEIRGHRRTYVGALPGRLIHALKRAGSRNPVIVLDEIDKIGRDYRGDPSSALLEVLDPEQNRAFSDHYLDVPFDLSQVLFLCTANLADPIPAALHDRLEIIEIPGYIQEEKLQIARQHLVPRQMQAHGLQEGLLEITDEAIVTLIERYTREAGVRNLDRELAAIHRKAARRVVEGDDSPQVVATLDDVRNLLGPPRHFPELAERADQPGIAIGLAWTAAGGDILFIEATRYPGNGKAVGLKLTGHLGDVMKESVEAALSLLRSRADSLGLTPADFQGWDFHLHVPAGAIPKDGPSAGVTMLTALTSLLTGRRVRHELAMTGEITLRGKVLPVGGIKEKVLAARRAGVQVVLLPRRNEGDLDDVPAQVRQELDIRLVDTVDEVLDLGLEPARSV
ncbi:MAG: endopeptidase La [Deltaproteobacteria bacterium]|nr:MAG: endopeptidase La [Deltaproteobacteria bacterium]